MTRDTAPVRTGPPVSAPAGSPRPRDGDPARPDRIPSLTGRDLEVLAGLARGRSTAQIAASLSVSSNTARTRIRRVQGKLDVAGRAAAVRAARDLGVLGDGVGGAAPGRLPPG